MSTVCHCPTSFPSTQRRLSGGQIAALAFRSAHAPETYDRTIYMSNVCGNLTATASAAVRSLQRFLEQETMLSTQRTPTSDAPPSHETRQLTCRASL
jgi:hypothetical protein